MGDEENERVADALAMHRTKGTKWERIPCPFCDDMGHKDKKTSLGVNAVNGIWHCFRCGESGRIEKILDEDMFMASLFPNGKLLQKADQAEDEIVLVSQPEEFQPLWKEPGLTDFELAPARRYLKSRGVTSRALLKALQIGACASGNWVSNDGEKRMYVGGRIIVPFLLSDHKGWLGWIGRLWQKKPMAAAKGISRLPYLYPSGMPRGRFLYNHDALRVETEDPAIVVEGAFDTFPFWPNGVAALGKLSYMQIDALYAAKRPIVLVPDGDEWQAAEALALRMRFDGKRCGWIKLPPRVDPDEVDSSWLIEEARRSLDRSV